MAESSSSKSEDRRAHLGIGNDLNTKDICKPRPAIVSKCAEDEVFTLLVKDQYARYHLCINVCLDLLSREIVSVKSSVSLATGEGFYWGSWETRLKRVLCL